MPVHVVTGPPCAGKSTYVRAHAQPDDIMIDYDVLASALGSSRSHGHAPWFNRVVGKARWAAIKAALDIAQDNPGITVWIIDSVIPDYRLRAYEAANAEFVRMEVDPAELHRRADVERPDLWHQLIDDWAPLLRDAGPSWHPEREHQYSQHKPWPKRPAHRRGAHGPRYERLRAAFLADKTHCERCGQPFVLDAPCEHPRCRKRGKGCWSHPRYPSVQHTAHLAGGAPSLDVLTWAAWCLQCNHVDGGHYGRARQLARTQERERDGGGRVDLDW